jgi:hypothetical protein
MLDVFYIVITLVFFAVGASLARGCDKLHKDDSDA